MSSSAAETRTSATVEQSAAARLMALVYRNDGPLVGLVLCAFLALPRTPSCPFSNLLNVLDQVTVLGIWPSA